MIFDREILSLFSKGYYMKKVTAISTAVTLLLYLLTIAGCFCVFPSARSKEQVLDGIVDWVVANRQLEKISDIEYEFISSEVLRQQLLDSFNDENSLQGFQTDGELLILLGLIAPEDDLYTIMLDLYTEQVAGFYDSETKKLYVVSDNPTLSVMEMVTFAHEVTHALQDQHYGLKALYEQAGDDSEYSAAITSLIEGDAMLMSSLYMMNGLSRSEQQQLINEYENIDSEKFDAAPWYIQQSIMFPYSYGYQFVYQLYQDGGWDAVNSAYANLPSSTEQIIHPDKYAAGDNPILVELPDLVSLLGETWQIQKEGTVGEFDLRLTLEAFIDPSETTREAAAGWSGDSYAYLKNDAEDKLLVIYSVWDTEADAQQFFTTYAANRADATWTLIPNENGSYAWQSGSGYLYLEKTGDHVLLINAPDSAIAASVRNAVIP